MCPTSRASKYLFPGLGVQRCKGNMYLSNKINTSLKKKLRDLPFQAVAVHYQQYFYYRTISFPPIPKCTVNSPDTEENRPILTAVKFKDNMVFTVHNITQLYEVKDILLQSNKNLLANKAAGEIRGLGNQGENRL